MELRRDLGNYIKIIFKLKISECMLFILLMELGIDRVILLMIKI